jgi:hypothetical protein
MQVHAGGVEALGTDVQKTIDTTLARLLKSADQRLIIKPSSCPQLIDVSGGKVSWCTLTVDNVALPVRVVGSGASFKVNFVGTFYERSIIEKTVANIIKESNGLSLAAHCPGKVVELLPDYATFICGLTGSPIARSARVRAMPKGRIFVYNVPGLKSLSRIPDNVLTLHKNRKHVSVDGKVVVAFIKSGIAANPIVSNQLNKTIITCPDRLDLTGTKHGVCLARIRETDVVQRIDVWIDDVEGFGTRPLDAVLRGDKVQALIEQDLNARLRDNGDAPDAGVTCRIGRFSAPVHSQFSCAATVAGKRYNMMITVQDYTGRLSWHGVEATPQP